MCWPRRFRGMIAPGMAGSFEDAERVAKRKSIWVVQYLRARRTWDVLIGFYRRTHFHEKRRSDLCAKSSHNPPAGASEGET